MNFRRIYQTIRLQLTYKSSSRTRFLKKNNVFAMIGDNTTFHPRSVPLYPELIKLHDNVRIAANVLFLTHDIIYRLINEVEHSVKHRERVGCIEIMNNVFIGANSIVLYNVRINENVIVAAGSVVVKDLEKNGVYAGVPAKRIGSFDDYISASLKWSESFPSCLSSPQNQDISKELVDYMWEKFNSDR